MTRAMATLAALSGLLAAGAAGAGAPGSPERGAAIFQAHCVLCHGPEARGCGPAARLYLPRPANLTASTRSPEYKAAIIRGGGASMDRSPSMPPWGGELSDAEIADVVAHLSTLERKEDLTC